MARTMLFISISPKCWARITIARAPALIYVTPPLSPYTLHPSPPLSPSLHPYFSLTAAALIEGELETGSHRRVGACLFIRTSRLLFLSFFSPSPSSSSGLNQKPAPPPPIQHNFSRSAGFRLPKSHLPWNPSVQIWRRWAAVQPPSGGEEGVGGGRRNTSKYEKKKKKKNAL